MKPHRYSSRNGPRIRIERPVIRNSEDEMIWKEICHFLCLIPQEPDPNFGRVHELREEIKKGNYVTPEVLEETAARLAIRFMKRE